MTRTVCEGPNVLEMEAGSIPARRHRAGVESAAGLFARRRVCPDGPYAHRPIYAGVACALAGQVVRHAGSCVDPELTRSFSTLEAQTILLPRCAAR
jgi:hypothetical protein